MLRLENRCCSEAHRSATVRSVGCVEKTLMEGTHIGDRLKEPCFTAVTSTGPLTRNAGHILKGRFFQYLCLRPKYFGAITFGKSYFSSKLLLKLSFHWFLSLYTSIPSILKIFGFWGHSICRLRSFACSLVFGTVLWALKYIWMILDSWEGAIRKGRGQAPVLPTSKHGSEQRQHASPHSRPTLMWKAA